MIEIRIHGRGGQGGKKAAQIISRAAHYSGYNVQDFAMYGAERKGAPVKSFVRFSKTPIKTRGYIFEPDCIIILDESIGVNKCIKGKKEHTKIIINSKKPYKNIKNSCSVNAIEIAMKYTKKAICNVAILGAWAKLFKKIPLKNIEKAVYEEFKEKLTKDMISKNIKAMKEVYDNVA